MTWPGPAEDTHLFILGDDAVLYSHRLQELYSFNTAATLIWCSLELGQTRAETVSVLSRALRTSDEQALAHIESCLTQWAALGILAGSERPVRERRHQTTEISLPGPRPQLPPLPEMPMAIERRYRLLETGVRVRYQSHSEYAWVHPVLAHLETPKTDCATTVTVTSDGKGHCIYVDGRPYGRCSGLDRLAPYVKAALWQSAIGNHRYFLHIHAGVVSDGESLILLPAPSGRGKSTLTASLVHAGFQYFSDEVALLEEGSFRAVPVPVSFCVKSAAWDLLAPLFPELLDLATHQRPDRKVVRYLPPPPRSLPTDLGRSLPVRRIIFPWYQSGSTTTLRSLSQAEALSRLLSQCLAVPLDLDPARVAALVRWISSVKAHELIMSSLDDAMALVGGVHMAGVGEGPGKPLRPSV
jgi:hypothetical protein